MSPRYVDQERRDARVVELLKQGGVPHRAIAGETGFTVRHVLDVQARERDKAAAASAHLAGAATDREAGGPASRSSGRRGGSASGGSQRRGEVFELQGEKLMAKNKEKKPKPKKTTADGEVEREVDERGERDGDDGASSDGDGSEHVYTI